MHKELNNSYLPQEGDILEDNARMARNKLRRTVEAEIRDMGSLTTRTIKGNESKIVDGTKIYGEKYIGNSLPSNCRLFSIVIIRLKEMGVFTEDDLVNLSSSNLLKIRDSKRETDKYIRLMRSYVVAKGYLENRENSNKTFNHPRGRWASL
ncbi:MAG: hypothetical protein A2687_01215 [Candidatus Levybacteria bacterium RIFCSPHIGHO2_01_FULL_38_26]|nr:MAG: hypothetical protein A2687_01215 [Candidatus Levybacteria bacterium RIFCSPHIGHO2_01_FULL_38_26]